MRVKAKFTFAYLILLLLSGCISLEKKPTELGEWTVVGEEKPTELGELTLIIDGKPIGLEEWMTLVTKCEDSYRFDDLGLLYIKSGDQELVQNYLITKVKNSQYLSFQTLVIENNQKTDCLGNLGSKVGSQLNTYIKFDGKKKIRLYLYPNEKSYLDIYLMKVK